MNAKVLKIIALITMTIDHIGLYLVESDTFIYTLLRVIGRIAFPLFAFLVAEGFHHSRDRNKYFIRLLGYCLIIEIGVVGIYLVTGENYVFKFNVIWPLVLGLLSLILLYRNEWYFQILVIGLLIGSELLKMPYGAYGIGTIIIFGGYRKLWAQALMFFVINLIFLDWPLWGLLGRTELAKYGALQWFAVIALVPIYFYNGKGGKSNKWFFYLYYPAHLGIIYLLGLLV